jgi:hypothetical protein
VSVRRCAVSVETGGREETIVWRWFPDQAPGQGQFGALFSGIGTRWGRQRGRRGQDEPVAK